MYLSNAVSHCGCHRFSCLLVKIQIMQLDVLSPPCYHNLKADKTHLGELPADTGV